ncbi:threonylcarbamoyl-AMP synthase [Candidatus Parcubacteria bacterium]|nr:MAG: threonylcarbamoyl-AMP synthase [Candidatus Parcubacteria bacterium]
MRILAYRSFSREVIETLKRGGVAVIPTDTIYGIVGSALQPATVRRIYKLRKRNPKKPMIVLISSVADLKLFGAKVDSITRRILRKIWPGKVSVILSLVRSQKSKVMSLRYLHRGTNTLAFRMPKPHLLQNLLKKVGPLVTPSANWEGKLPAKTVREAKRYFKNKVDFYIDGGKLKSLPSTLVIIHDKRVKVLRKGAGYLGNKMK